MDIQQQTKNVAAQGRFGDSMLLHVNPAEVKGLASAVPLTINPETGQPEAFLPFLAPILGSMGITALAGTGVGAALGLGGLSAGALAGLGAGLATYAQTGGSGSKALLSGLTAGMGTKALEGVAAGAAPALDPAIANAQVAAGVGDVGVTTLASQQAAGAAAAGPLAPGVTAPAYASLNPVYNTGTAGSSLNTIFNQPGGFDAGMKSLAGAAMTPSGMVAGTAAGTAGVIASQEEFERQMAQLTEDEEERKRRMYEMYPEQIPMASGGRTGFRPGGQTGEDYPREDLYINDYYGGSNYNDPMNRFNYSGGYSGGNNYTNNNPYQNSSNIYSTPRQRRTRPIGSGFMPGFMPEYSYFEGMNPSATALGYDPLGNFQNPQLVNQGGYSQSSRGRGGLFGGLFGRGRGLQPLSPPGGFRDEGGYGYTPPPPQFAGYGNPFMQSASYQGFYGVPQMQQMLNPYARFTQQPMPYQPYQPYVPPVETPPDDGGTPPDDGGGTGGGGIPPIDPPIDDGGGRKGAVKNVPPIAPEDDFTVGTLGGSGYGRFPLGTAGPEYIYDDSGNPVMQPPINVPGGGGINYGGPGNILLPPIPPKPIPPQDFGFGPGIRPSEIINSDGTMTGSAGVTPPPTVTIPIEGGADVTIPDFSRPQPPRIEPPMRRPEPPMSIGGPGGGMADLRIEPPMQNKGPAPIKNPVSVIQAPAPEPTTQSFFDMFPDAPQRPQMGTMDIRYYKDPVTGLMKQGSSTDVGYRNKLKEYLDSNPEASANYYKRNPLLSEEEIAERNKGMFNPIARTNLRASAGNPALNISSQPAIALPNVPTMPAQNLREPFIPPTGATLKQVNLDDQYGNQQFTSKNFPGQAELKADAPGNAPQPIGQEPQTPQTGGIPITGGGPLGSGILPVANLPSGTNAPTAPAPRAIQGPTGPAMGGISAVPTPAAPPQNVGNNPPPMSIGGPGGGRGGIFGAPMFAAGGDTDLPNEGLEALSKTEKGREAIEAMGYQEGGQTDMMQDPVTQDVIMFILGETDNENAINAFVEKYGAEQFMFLRDKILKQAAGNPDAQTEGLIQGNGNSGMADDLPGVIGNKEKIAVSQDEFIVPADVVSMLGDGSSDAGSKQLYNMMDRVRQAKTGGTTQAPPLNPQKVLPA